MATTARKTAAKKAAPARMPADRKAPGPYCSREADPRRDC